MIKINKYVTKSLALLILPAALFIAGAGTAKAASVSDQLNNASDSAPFKMTASVIELENTTAPTTILVRDSSGTEPVDYVVEIDANTVVAAKGEWSSDLSWWLVGDVLRIWGTNAGNFTIHADAVVNESIDGVKTWNQNGFITATDCANDKITILWNSSKYRIDLNEDSRFIIPPNSNAACSDLMVGDRIRARGVKHATLNIIQARTVFVLRRGIVNYVLRRTDQITGTLIQIGGTDAPFTIKVKTLGDNPVVYNINFTQNSKVRNRLLANGDPNDWLPGDNITFLVKKESSDEGDYERTAVWAKNNSIWKVATMGVSGVITNVDKDANQFTMVWGPNDRKFRIDLNDRTHLVKAGMGNATIDDVLVGDLVQGRGEKHAQLPIISADIMIIRTP